jgi:hypothetical protein
MRRGRLGERMPEALRDAGRNRIVIAIAPGEERVLEA